MKKNKENTNHKKELKALIDLLQDHKNWHPPQGEPVKKKLKSAKNTTESITFERLTSHIKNIKIYLASWIGLSCLTFTTFAILLPYTILGYLGLIASNSGFVLGGYLVSAAALIGCIFAVGVLSYLTTNKFDMKKINTTQQNMKTFFKKRGLKEEDYKDKSVLQTIRGNTVEASV